MTTELKVFVTIPVLLARVNRRPEMQAWFISQREGVLFPFITELAFSVQMFCLCREFDVQ